MDKDKALESVNEIKELMEKSSKFISLSGLAAIMAGIYALAGAYIATQVITPGTHLIVALELMAIIASLVLVAAAVTACILSYYKSKKTGQKFFSRLALPRPEANGNHCSATVPDCHRNRQQEESRRKAYGDCRQRVLAAHSAHKYSVGDVVRGIDDCREHRRHRISDNELRYPLRAESVYMSGINGHF